MSYVCFAWPLAARAQLGPTRHIGVLMNGAATETAPQSYVAAFVQTLRQLGWTEGQNVRIDIRWSAGDAALARTYAAQLIGLTPDVMLASSTTNLIAIQQATNNASGLIRIASVRACTRVAKAASMSRLELTVRTSTCRPMVEAAVERAANSGKKTGAHSAAAGHTKGRGHRACIR
jgi:ABC-type uncharacterized transport system substrate-binding protein